MPAKQSTRAMLVQWSSSLFLPVPWQTSTLRPEVRLRLDRHLTTEDQSTWLRWSSSNEVRIHELVLEVGEDCALAAASATFNVTKTFTDPAIPATSKSC